MLLEFGSKHNMSVNDNHTILFYNLKLKFYYNKFCSISQWNLCNIRFCSMTQIRYIVVMHLFCRHPIACKIDSIQLPFTSSIYCHILTPVIHTLHMSKHLKNVGPFQHSYFFSHLLCVTFLVSNSVDHYRTSRFF